MPVAGAQDIPNDLDATEAAAADAPVPQSVRYGAEANFGGLTQAALHAVRQPLVDAGNDLGFDLSGALGRDTELTPDQANTQYGVEGYLRFNQPTTPDDAAWQSAQAQQRQYRDTVLARSRPNPLMDIGSSLVGSLTDPVGVGLMAVTGGLGEGVMGAIGLGEAADSGVAMSRLGRVFNPGSLARTAAVGALDNAPYVYASGALTNYSGDEYGFGDALRDIAAGAILHTVVHTAQRALSDGLGHARAMGGEPNTGAEPNAFTPNPAPASGVPEAVDALSPVERSGAFAKALDDLAGDNPVDVGEYVDRASSAIAPPAADDAAAATAPGDATPPEDFAATPRPERELAADQDPARQILSNLAGSFARNDPGAIDLRAPGRADGRDSVADPAEPPVIDLSEASKEEGGAGPTAENGVGAGGAGAKPAHATGESLIAGDPELKALAEDNARLATGAGIDIPAADPKQDPNTLAEAIRAAAFCLAENG